MAAENLELVREMFAFFDHGDIDRVLTFVHEDFEICIPPEASAEPDVYRGNAGLLRYWESFNFAMEDVHFEAERYWESGDQMVVATRTTARGRQTAIAVEQLVFAVWSFRDGKVLGIHVFSSQEKALQAVGLAE